MKPWLNACFATSLIITDVIITALIAESRFITYVQILIATFTNTFKRMDSSILHQMTVFALYAVAKRTSMQMK